MKKTSLYDNPSGYGHGGLGYHHSLDELPYASAPSSQTPAWLPWLGLAGAGVLGYAGLRGLGRLFRRAPKGGVAAKAMDPAAAYEMEMMGRVDPRWNRMAEGAERRMAEQQQRLARKEMFEKEREISRQQMAQEAPAGAQWISPTLGKVGFVLPALGRIARGD